MLAKNICKFVPAAAANSLEVKNFIYESNKEVMGERSISQICRAMLVSSGEGFIHIDSQQYALEVGSLIFSFPGEEIFSGGSSNFEYMYISFTGARSDELFRRFGINRTARLFEGFEGLIPLWRDSLSRGSEENIDLCAESMLLYTFSRLSCESAEKNNIINNIVSISEERFTENSLSVSAIAEELGYNAKYISHLFKEKMGVGYSEYLRTLRIKYAVSLFDHGLDSVKNVALLSGFTDPLYFSSVFKKTVGISPKEYKARDTSAIEPSAGGKK